MCVCVCVCVYFICGTIFIPQKWYYYCLPTKLQEGNVSTGVCHPVRRVGPYPPGTIPIQTLTLPPPPRPRGQAGGTNLTGILFGFKVILLVLHLSASPTSQRKFFEIPKCVVCVMCVFSTWVPLTMSSVTANIRLASLWSLALNENIFRSSLCRCSWALEAV